MRSEDVQIKTVLRLMGDGVLHPGEVLPVLPGHLVQGLRHVVHVGRELLGTGRTVADSL